MYLPVFIYHLLPMFYPMFLLWKYLILASNFNNMLLRPPSDTSKNRWSGFAGHGSRLLKGRTLIGLDIALNRPQSLNISANVIHLLIIFAVLEVKKTTPKSFASLTSEKNTTDRNWKNTHIAWLAKADLMMAERWISSVRLVLCPNIGWQDGWLVVVEPVSKTMLKIPVV